jgi:hypothetical protein
VRGTGYLRDRATKLHSKVVRTRGSCQRCGESRYDRLQCAHIVPRRFNATRTDEANAWCLCGDCHFTVDTWSAEKVNLVEDTIGIDAYWQLRAKAEAGQQSRAAFWRSEIRRLSQLLKEAA